jgi:hypothetical protein
MGHIIAHGSQSIVYTIERIFHSMHYHVANSMSSQKVTKLAMVFQIIGCMEYEKTLSTLTFMTWKDFKVSFVSIWIWWFIVCITL